METLSPIYPATWGYQVKATQWPFMVFTLLKYPLTEVIEKEAL
jgi:hypothetical protein